MGDARAFEQMKAVAGRAPIATLAVREQTIEHGAPRDEVARFADAVRARAHRPPQRRKARASG